jgi:hypothetical protein
VARGGPRRRTLTSPSVSDCRGRTSSLGFNISPSEVSLAAAARFPRSSRVPLKSRRDRLLKAGVARARPGFRPRSSPGQGSDRGANQGRPRRPCEPCRHGPCRPSSLDKVGTQRMQSHEVDPGYWAPGGGGNRPARSSDGGNRPRVVTPDRVTVPSQRPQNYPKPKPAKASPRGDPRGVTPERLGAGVSPGREPGPGSLAQKVAKVAKVRGEHTAIAHHRSLCYSGNPMSGGRWRPVATGGVRPSGAT